jgi:hypothetical protein
MKHRRDPPARAPLDLLQDDGWDHPPGPAAIDAQNVERAADVRIEVDPVRVDLVRDEVIAGETTVAVV